MGAIIATVTFGCFTSLVLLCFWSPCFHAAKSSITNDRPLAIGETMSSPNQTFELGFVPKSTISSTTIWYLGIWHSYLEERWVVWIANRKNPVSNASPSLKISDSGNLIISSANGTEIPVTSVTPISKNTSAKLLESGNLVLLEEASGRVLWQSFDHPTDTLLPGMKLRQNLFLTSGLTDEIPYPGPFTLGINPNGTDQFVIWYRGHIYWKSSLWNSSGSIKRLFGMNIHYSFESDEDGKYFNFAYNQTGDDILFSLPLQITSVGHISWPGIDMCGGKRADNDELDDCRTLTWPNCISGNGRVFANYRVARYKINVVNESSSLGLTDCEFTCKSNCSCVAYAAMHSNGTGCLYRYDNMDHPEVAYDFPFFIARPAANEGNLSPVPQAAKLENPAPASQTNVGNHSIAPRADAAAVAKGPGRKRWKLWIIIMLPVSFIIVLLEFAKCRLQRMEVHRKENNAERELSVLELSSSIHAGAKFSDIGKKGLDLPSFSLSNVLAITDNFSNVNKLGEGGFGPVYKGKLLNEQDVAVKRLSRSSAQGQEEFKNEVLLISKLQHKNLVKLIGMCNHGEEKILIYEYMPNKSLDVFLFDPAKREILDWGKRVHIIDGIAQGLLYLHKYSRLTVIHRDLKASNILLDGDMNPKISDFGMARMFNGNQSKANTNRVVGTYGYMSPEYAMEGIFSMKSDVFSFGVLLLEIMTSKRNTNFHHFEHSLNLLGYAWEVWNEGRGLQLIDPILVDSSAASELMRYVHVALLCVQERVTDRPTMSEVILFLNNQNAAMLSPKQPAFFVGRNAPTTSLPTGEPRPCSINDVTVSTMGGR